MASIQKNTQNSRSSVLCHSYAGFTRAFSVWFRFSMKSEPWKFRVLMSKCVIHRSPQAFSVSFQFSMKSEPRNYSATLLCTLSSHASSSVLFIYRVLPGLLCITPVFHNIWTPSIMVPLSYALRTLSSITFRTLSIGVWWGFGVKNGVIDFVQGNTF